MRVAFYTKRYDRLLGIFQLTPHGIEAHPATPGERRRLQAVLRYPRPAGRETDAAFLAALPRLYRDQCIVLGEGQEPEPGFEDESDTMTAARDGGGPKGSHP